MPRWRSLLLIAAMSATTSALVLAGLRHFHPFRFGRLEFTYDETWCPSPPRIVLFPDGKIDMTIVDQHSRTVLIHPMRSALTENEASRLRALIEAVDWNRVRPHYDTEVENGEESVCRITIGNSVIETSVDAIGEAHEPEELTALFHYLKDLLLVLAPPEPADGTASDPDDEIEHSDDQPLVYYSDERLLIPAAPDLPQASPSPREHYGPFKQLIYEYGSSWGPPIPSLTLLPNRKLGLAGVRPNRSELTDAEISRLNALIDEVDWKNVQPYYQPNVPIMDGGVCSLRISFGEHTFGTSVYCPGFANEPYEVNALFMYLGKIYSIATPPESPAFVPVSIGRYDLNYGKKLHYRRAEPRRGASPRD